MKRFLLTVLSLFLSLSFYSCAIKKDETDKMIDQMTLREKAAQMLMPSIRYETFYSDDCFSYLTELNEAYTKLIAGNGFGGIILLCSEMRIRRSISARSRSLTGSPET